MHTHHGPTGDAVECLGRITLDPPLRPPEHDDLLWSAELQPPAWCGWDFCPAGCCLRLVGAATRADAEDELQCLVDAVRERGLGLTGLMVVRRSDGEIFSLRVSRHRVHSSTLREADPPRHTRSEEGLASVTSLTPRAQTRG